VLRAVKPCHLAGPGSLVEERHILETDGVGLHGPRRVPRHESHDDARVDAAAEEGPHGDVGNHVAPDGFVHRLEQERLLLLETRLRAVRKPRVIDVPVFSGADRSAAEAEGLPRQELPDVLEDAEGGRDVIEGQVEPERLPVDPPLHGGMPEDRFDFRGEEEGAAVTPPDEGLDADAITAQDERAHLLVPDGEGKHARKPARALNPSSS